MLRALFSSHMCLRYASHENIHLNEGWRVSGYREKVLCGSWKCINFQWKTKLSDNGGEWRKSLTRGADGVEKRSFGSQKKVVVWSKIEINVYVLSFYLLFLPYRDAHFLGKQISTLFCLFTAELRLSKIWKMKLKQSDFKNPFKLFFL